MIDILLNHRSIRKFETERPVSEETVETILRCAQMAPTSSHFQCYTIIRTRDSVKKSLLAEIAGGQEWVKQAPVVLLFCGDLHRSKKYYKHIDPGCLENTEAYTVAVADASLAMQKAYIAAQAVGLGGVVVGGIRNNVEKVAELFRLPEMVFPLYLLCLGYPAEEPGQKPRLPMDVVVKEEFYDEREDDQNIARYDADMRDYYTQRTGGTSRDSWTERSGAYLMAKPRDEVGEYVRKIGLLQR